MLFTRLSCGDHAPRNCPPHRRKSVLTPPVESVNVPPIAHDEEAARSGPASRAHSNASGESEGSMVLVKATVAGMAALSLSGAVSAATLVAADDYESGGASYGSGGGTGFGVHTDLAGPGNIFGETGSPRIDGNQSLGSFSNGGSEEFGRTVTDTSAFNTALPGVSFSASLRFNIPNSNSTFKGLNLKTALGSTFNANEIISVGLTSASNTGLLVTGTTTQTLELGQGDLRGDILDVTLVYDRPSGAYTLTADNRDDPGAAVSISGTVKSPGGSNVPGAIGFIHSDVGGPGNNIYFDNLSLSAVPEPVSVLGGTALLGVVTLRRRSPAVA